LFWHRQNGKATVLSLTDVSRLLPSERQQRIKRLALEQGVLRIGELAEKFRVSEMTIRRDLEMLEEAGHVERTFGGAFITEQAAFESSYSVRLHTQTPEKEAIATYAATLIQDGDTIILDASTTVLALARKLSKKSLTVVTNSLDVAQELRNSPVKVILSGGYLRQVAGSFAGPIALKALKDLHVDQAFISGKGIQIPGGLMDSDIDEVEVKRVMLESAERVNVLMDSSKFGKRALGLISSLDTIDFLISDDKLSSESLQSLNQHGVSYHLVRNPS
jgi:DeoR family transcriptional regulator, fructose operon transcriptional repressor